MILAGAPLAGLATTLRDAVPVPLVDPLAAALGQARRRWCGSGRGRPGRTLRPAARETGHGLSGPLARWIAHREGEP